MYKQGRSRTKVLFLAEELRVGGAETYFYRLESGIDRTSIDFHTMAVLSDMEDSLTRPELFSPYTFSAFDRVRAIAKQLRCANYDVIHANSLQLLFCAYVARLKSHSKVPIVYTRHNKTALEVFSKSLYFRVINRLADNIITICKTEESNLIDGGVSRAKIKLINNAVNPDTFPFSQRFVEGRDIEPKIGILARISPEKRHDLFLDIARTYHRMCPQSRYFIAGDGPDSEKISSEIANSEMKGFVRMVGKVDPSEFLPKVDLLLLVSDREVMPMSILEGMASGCGIVARSVGGVKDVVRSDTGVLIDGSDPLTYAYAINDAIRMGSFEEKTRNARRLIEDEFSLDRALNKHKELYLLFNSAS